MVSVDYRLAPESKYPVAAEDSYAALRWVVANAARLGIDARRVAVGGDSAGGNLATVVALMARERSGPRLVRRSDLPRSPTTISTRRPTGERDGYVLTREGMRWFWNHYLAREADGREPCLPAPGVEPRRAPAGAHHRRVRSAAGRGRGVRRRLRDAGAVPVTLTRYDGMFHGFVRMTRILDKARTALDEIASSLQKAFADRVKRPEARGRDAWPRRDHSGRGRSALEYAPSPPARAGALLALAPMLLALSMASFAGSSLATRRSS